MRRALGGVLDSALCTATEGTRVNLRVYCGDYTKEEGVRMQLRFDGGPAPGAAAGGIEWDGREGGSSLATFGVEMSKSQIENLGGSVLTREAGIDIVLPSSPG